MEKTLRLHINGRVQGVCFRAWTVREAKIRGVTGWVRNLRNGSVEALFSGDGDTVDDLVDACKRGPEMARVADITIHPDSDPGLSDFRQLPTA